MTLRIEFFIRNMNINCHLALLKLDWKQHSLQGKSGDVFVTALCANLFVIISTFSFN
jgi:hypothetical protein